MMIISVVVFMTRRLLQRRRAVHPYPTYPTARTSKKFAPQSRRAESGHVRAVSGVNLTSGGRPAFQCSHPTPLQSLSPRTEIIPQPNVLRRAAPPSPAA